MTIPSNEVIARCEGCGREIREGDAYQVWEDNVRTCEQHSAPGQAVKRPSIPSDSVPFPGATPRPWRKCGGYTAKFVAICSDEANQYVVFEMANPYEDGIESRECPSDETQQANAALIVEAVNSYDALRTERDALKAEVQRLREAGSTDLLESARSVVSEWQKYLDDDGVMHPGRAIYDAIAQLTAAVPRVS